ALVTYSRSRTHHGTVRSAAITGPAAEMLRIANPLGVPSAQRRLAFGGGASGNRSYPVAGSDPSHSDCVALKVSHTGRIIRMPRRPQSFFATSAHFCSQRSCRDAAGGLGG